jgi:hypothetical protein
LLTESPTSWTVSTVGSGVKRIAVTSDTNCFIYAPAIESSWANMDSDEIFAITNYSESIPLADRNAQFQINMNLSTGEFSILSKSLQKTMCAFVSASDEETIVASFRSEISNFKGWELIPVVPTHQLWSVPTWLSKDKSSIPNLADGVYRISNGQTKTSLALGAHDGDPGTLGVQITGNLREVSANQPLP